MGLFCIDFLYIETIFSLDKDSVFNCSNWTESTVSNFLLYQFVYTMFMDTPFMDTAVKVNQKDTTIYPSKQSFYHFHKLFFK